MDDVTKTQLAGQYKELFAEQVRRMPGMHSLAIMIIGQGIMNSQHVTKAEAMAVLIATGVLPASEIEQASAE